MNTFWTIVLIIIMLCLVESGISGIKEIKKNSNAKEIIKVGASFGLIVSILLYRDDIQSINLFSQNEDLTSRFELVQEDNNFSYMATTYCTFHNNYKKVMSTLNDRVQTEFPEVQFKFDGSRILAHSVCK